MKIKFGAKCAIYSHILDFKPMWYIEHQANGIKKQSNISKIDWLNENIGKENYLLHFGDSIVPHYIMFKNEEDAMAFKLRFI